MLSTFSLLICRDLATVYMRKKFLRLADSARFYRRPAYQRVGAAMITVLAHCIVFQTGVRLTDGYNLPGVYKNELTPKPLAYS